ncbi:MAG: aminoglycoside phosphotransferase family protein [bacterium]
MSKYLPNIDLTIKNVTDYFNVRVIKHLPWNKIRLINATEIISFSNVNYIFKLRLTTSQGQKLIFLKQAQKYNKRSVARGKPIYMTPVRMTTEVQVTKIFSSLLPRNVIAKVLYFDRANFVSVLSDVGSSKLLASEFTENRVHPEIATMLAKYLATMHGRTWKSKNKVKLNPGFTIVLKDFVNSHLAGGMKKHASPKSVSLFIKTSQKHSTSIIWGDAVFRNIFVHPKGRVSLIDFDMARMGDPAYDLGFLLSHWIWMSLHNSKKLQLDSHKFLEQFTDKYQSTMSKYISDSELTALWLRAYKWMGIYLISRVDNPAGSYFKKWPAWEKRIRQTGIDLFTNN